MSASLTKEMLNAYVGKTVRFTDKLEDLETTYAEPGMRAIVSKIDFNIHNDDPTDNTSVVHVVWVNYEPFEDENHLLMVPNYYDTHGVPCLTALEAGWYKKRDSLYLSGFPEQVPFEVVE